MNEPPHRRGQCPHGHDLTNRIVSILRPGYFYLAFPIRDFSKYACGLPDDTHERALHSRDYEHTLSIGGE
jgi:hypothetical protein